MYRVLLGIVALCVTAASAAAERLEQVLISAGRNIHIPEWTTRGGSGAGAWSVRKTVLHGGKQEGVDVIVVDNGRLQMTIVPTRGMSILSVTLGDVRLGWDSPVKEVVHPRHMNLQSRGGLGWLEGFNEWMVRCGLESNGHPGTDKFINNVGEEATMELTLHGKIGNIPASEVVVVIDSEPRPTIRVRGRVDERMFYGPKLELWTEVSTEIGSNRFQVSDRITNHGADQQEFQMLYHANFGRPLLEEGATFLGTVQRVVPFNQNAAKGRRSYDQYAGPSLGFIEQVYCIHPLAGPDGNAMAMLRNKAQDRGVSITYRPEQLPYLTLWKNTNAEAEGYVTGIEPGTGFPYNRRIERSFGRVPKLAPGASRRFDLEFAILVGAEQVKAAADRIAQTQGQRPVMVEPEPAKVD